MSRKTGKFFEKLYLTPASMPPPLPKFGYLMVRPLISITQILNSPDYYQQDCGSTIHMHVRCAQGFSTYPTIISRTMVEAVKCWFRTVLHAQHLLLKGVAIVVREIRGAVRRFWRVNLARQTDYHPAAFPRPVNNEFWVMILKIKLETRAKKKH